MHSLAGQHRLDWSTSRAMTFTQERIGRLRELGLSEYASRAYLALLELGRTEARDVSRLARIPLAKIYSTLEQLQERGLVEVAAEVPKKYAPVPLGDFVLRLSRSHEEEAERLRESAEQLALAFPIVGATEMNDRGGVTTVRGRRSFVEKARESISGAREDILVLASRGLLLRVGALRHALEQAQQRGVAIRFLTPALPDVQVPEEMPLGEVRVRPPVGGQGLDVAIFILDSSDALVARFVPDDASLQTGKDVTVCLSETAIVAALRGLVEGTWQQAPPLRGARVSPRTPAER